MTGLCRAHSIPTGGRGAWGGPVPICNPAAVCRGGGGPPPAHPRKHPAPPNGSQTDADSADVADDPPPYVAHRRHRPVAAATPRR